MDPQTLMLLSAVLFVISIVGAYFSRTKASPTPASGLKRKEDTPAGAAASKAPKTESEFSKSIRIFYGTQTGTAEIFAKELGDLLKKTFEAKITITDFEDVELDSAQDDLQTPDASLVLCSTYGDGEPPDTCLPFFEWLQKKTEQEEEEGLSEMKFGVFALGNTQYEHFNNSGKNLDKFFAKLGAERIIDLGLGDDNEDIEEDFNKWKATVIPALASSGIVKLPGVGVDEASAPDTVVKAYVVETLEGAQGIAFPEVNVSKTKGYDAHNPFKATLSARRELHTSMSERSCLHVEVDLDGSQLSYETGDHLGIFPENDADLVKKMAARLEVDGEMMISVHDPAKSSKGGALKAVGEPNPLGHVGPLSVATALARYCDLLTPLRKPALTALAAFTSDAAQKEELERMAGPDGKTAYADWMMKPYRSVLEVLEAFPTCKPPLGAFFCSVVPRLQVRYYSISSSPRVAPSSPHCTVAVVAGATGTGRMHRGVASTWLGGLEVGKNLQVPAFVRKSSFRLPVDPTVPIVMVGPGTGLAPFRGFIQERMALKAEGAELGPALLFFGCRSKTVDFIYERELHEAEAAGVMRLDVAFSREGGAKVYVQHRIAQRGEEVYKLLKTSSGHFYICGDAKNMAKDVHKALLDLLSAEGGLSGVDAEKYVQEMTASGRYSRDVW
ncbi:multidrug-resistance type transporter aminotriazole resistance, variant 2 [Cymbomonas tetramitiformis]|uniref:NADPH--hemoprotein reductase n=1 Tax=Cymbomonas tetramitiformis TaxID=36881 RepID=A0AAE0BEJ1_9CHLO|nr:multidrug-resistance type transporter aminotriazole resistance, variant 2 [Cymbomonas tetramitiformis]